MEIGKLFEKVAKIDCRLEPTILVHHYMVFDVTYTIGIKSKLDA